MICSRNVMALPGFEFNYECMEEELTCPVCLELFADPLLLPCSHSVCRKCLQDIMDSRSVHKQDEGVECPSCRKVAPVLKDKVNDLPRNLALENVVIRYSEERSRSIRKSLSLESPISDLLVSQALDVELPEFPTESKQTCELCEGSHIAKAAWYCVQCQVAYCHSCFAKFHPRRGALARHKFRQPSEKEDADRVSSCVDHPAEITSVFCDNCRILVCHLCVCDEVGKHAGHKILAPDLAFKKIKETVIEAKESMENQLSVLQEQRNKLEIQVNQTKDLYSEICHKVEQQYTRFVEDIVSAVKFEKESSLKILESHQSSSVFKAEAHLSDSNAMNKELEDMLESCDTILNGPSQHSTLSSAQQVAPLLENLDRIKRETEAATVKYSSILRDKTIQKEMSICVESFYTAAVDTVNKLLGAISKPCSNIIIPHITSPASPTKPEAGHRVQNKCLTTWGFTSTTFTAEELAGSATWNVTVERNSAHWGNVNTGYLFGVGLSSRFLNVKDIVGMDAHSQGLVCTAGSLFYSCNGEQESIVTAVSLPISLAITVSMEHDNYIIFTYNIMGADQNVVLTGQKILVEPFLKKKIFPVFTVSQRVKILFPTIV